MKIYRHTKSILFILLPLISSFCSFAQNIEKLQSAELNEVSGLVISRNNIIYVHNDSGDTSRFFAINQQGKLLAIYYFKGDPAIRRNGVADSEDMTYGPGAEKGKNYLYVGDIGDNAGKRPYISVYRIPEPDKHDGTIQLSREMVHLKYPNGPQDAETMMIDPVLKKLIIVSKRQDTVGIYSTSLSFRDGETVTLQKDGSLFLPGSTSSKYVVSGDISLDGKQVLLKTYEKVYHWTRKGNESIAQALVRKPVELLYKREPQGEAIGFTPDGKGYYCISEGVNAVIYHYSLNLQDGD